MIAVTPIPPYYAVIFTSIRTEISDGYAELSDQMNELAAIQPGFLGMESARSDVGITVSYWDSLESIKKWKENTEHFFAQQMGRERFYQHYKTRISIVERDYEFEK